MEKRRKTKPRSRGSHRVTTSRMARSTASGRPVTILGAIGIGIGIVTGTIDEMKMVGAKGEGRTAEKIRAARPIL